LGDWNLFFATAAGSAATLVGLLFVATQLHIEVFKDPRNRWAALAQSTLTLFSVIFIVALFFLVPQMGLRIHGELIEVVVVFALWRTISGWWPVVRIAEKGRRHRIEQSFWLLVIPILVYGYLAAGGVQQVEEQPDSTLTVASAFLALFAIALRNAWRLVVAVAQEPA
jgi:hypothetical protein